MVWRGVVCQVAEEAILCQQSICRLARALVILPGLCETRRRRHVVDAMIVNPGVSGDVGVGVVAGGAMKKSYESLVAVDDTFVVGAAGDWHRLATSSCQHLKRRLRPA